VTQVQVPVALTIDYGDYGSLAAGAGAQEPLNAYWWDGEAWQGLLPCEGCSLSIEPPRIVAVLDHLTEFAVLAGEPPAPRSYIYLPLVLRAR
jgi:hypothetical protein